MKHVLALALVACAAPPRAPVVLANHADEPRPSPAPIARSVMAEVLGHWSGVDDDRWIYDLVIRANGRFAQKVIQADGSVCDQAGTIAEENGELVRTFTANTCNAAYVGGKVHDRVESTDGAHLVLRMESDYLIRYDRAP